MEDNFCNVSVFCREELKQNFYIRVDKTGIDDFLLLVKGNLNVSDIFVVNNRKVCYEWHNTKDISVKQSSCQLLYDERIAGLEKENKNLKSALLAILSIQPKTGMVDSWEIVNHLYSIWQSMHGIASTAIDKTR